MNENFLLKCCLFPILLTCVACQHMLFEKDKNTSSEILIPAQGSTIPEPSSETAQPSHPFLDMSWPIQWHRLQTCDIVKDVRLALQEAQRRLEALEQTPLDVLTWDNTLEILLHFDAFLESAWTKVNHLNQVCDSEELRSAYLEVLSEVTQFYTSIPFRPKLWKIVQNYAATAEAKDLFEIRSRYLQRTIESFIDSGADLDFQKKERILEIEQRLSVLTHQFEKNVLDAKNTWTHKVILEELRGLPESVLQTLATDTSSGTTLYQLTLQAPCFSPCMQYLESRELRQKLWEASLDIGRKEPYDNRPLIHEVLALKDEQAQILGEKTYADCILRRRMAKSGQSAMQFIEDLHRRIKKYFQKNMQMLQNYRSEQTTADGDMRPWDVAFWSEKLRQELHHFDEEALRPYFAIDSVLQGLFSLAKRLYDIHIRERPTYGPGISPTSSNSIPVWHKDVKFYEVFEASGNYIGAFYADWFPRSSKVGGAWMGELVDRRNADGCCRYPVGVICGNLTPPSESHPALLAHHEVLTIFHEFGHLLHGLFGKIDIASLNGTHVVWDFVELPSQLMENFCWDRESLDLFARHYVTGEPIPEELFQTMTLARNHLSGMDMMRQLLLSKLDLELHHHYEQYRNDRLEEVLQEVLKPYRPQWSVDTPSIIAQFNHIFSGAYGAGYYSYIWAQVLEADIFGAFKANGTLDVNTGHRFRRCILSAGDLRDADQLFRDFMGRDPDPEALLKREDLWEAEAE